MGKFTDYNVRLKGLSNGEHVFDFHIGQQFFTDMENSDVRDANIDVKLIVKVANGRYDLQFEINGQVTTLCDRCLDDLVLPIKGQYHILVEYGDDYNDDSDELLVIPASDAYLNVAYMIYDTVVLAIPMKHVHPMGKCNKQMTAILHKHRSSASDADAELENNLIDEMDSMPDDDANDWDAPKGCNADE